VDLPEPSPTFGQSVEVHGRDVEEWLVRSDKTIKERRTHAFECFLKQKIIVRRKDFDGMMTVDFTNPSRERTIRAVALGKLPVYDLLDSPAYCLIEGIEIVRAKATRLALTCYLAKSANPAQQFFDIGKGFTVLCVLSL